MLHAAYPQTVAGNPVRHGSKLSPGSVDTDVEKLKRRAVPGYEKVLQDGE